MRLTALFVIVLGVAVTPRCQPAEAKTVVVTADKLVDVASGNQVDKPLVIIVDGRITKVGKQGEAVPAGRRGSTCRG